MWLCVVYCLCDDHGEPSTVPGVPCVLPNDNYMMDG